MLRRAGHVDGPRAGRGLGPAVAVRIAVVVGDVAQGGRGHQHTVGFRRHVAGERQGRVHVMAVEGDVDLAPAHALHGEPVDEGFRRFAFQGLQHVAPGRDLGQAPALQGLGDGLDAVAGLGVQAVGLVVQLAGQALDQLAHGLAHLGECPFQFPGGGQQAVGRRMRLAFQGIAGVGVFRPGQHLGPQAGQEILRRAARPGLDALPPAWAGQTAGRRQHRLQRVLGLVVVGDQVFDPRPQPARPRPLAFLGADQPAP